MLTGNGDICGCRRAIAHSSLHLQLLCKQQGARPDLRPTPVVPTSRLNIHSRAAFGLIAFPAVGDVYHNTSKALNFLDAGTRTRRCC